MYINIRPLRAKHIMTMATATVSGVVIKVEGALVSDLRGCFQKFPDRPPGTRAANGIAFCH